MKKNKNFSAKNKNNKEEKQQVWMLMNLLKDIIMNQKGKHNK